MGYWALVVFPIPLLLTQFSFRRYASIRATYLQTSRSLARVTEVGGYTETGHARRVARLSLTIGRELGLSERELVDLEYAALMHDIGQLSLQEPIPGGATTMVTPDEQLRLLPHRTLVVHGREDKVIPVECSSHLAATIARAQLHIFGQCGHWSQIEYATEFNGLLLNFLTA